MLRIWWWFRRRTPQTFKPVILVTGCSSGIGLALARILRERHEYRVVVTTRRGSLDSLRTKFPDTDRFLVRPLDVTSPVERAALIQEIERRWMGVNILVNNAGISYRAVVEHMTDADEFNQMATNYFGPVSLIRLVMPHMRSVGRGKIVNISSVSGMLAMPTLASYSASKYALEGLSEALWYEGRPLGINVSLIQPGFVRSNSFEKVYYTERSRPENGDQGLYADYYAHMTPFIAKLMNRSLTSSHDIAKLIIKVIQTENPPLWIAATWDAMIFYYLRRWVPRRFLLPLLFHLLPGARRWGKKYTNRRAN
jgi:NAD(P)-dependent dehydrogenase (short-subunit alcohol dehydrogenase family)